MQMKIVKVENSNYSAEERAVLWFWRNEHELLGHYLLLGVKLRNEIFGYLS